MILLLLAFPLLASGQSVELGGGYAHISGDGGVDGFNAGAAMWVTDRVAMAFDYDSAWDARIWERWVPTNSLQESLAKLSSRSAHFFSWPTQGRGRLLHAYGPSPKSRSVSMASNSSL